MKQRLRVQVLEKVLTEVQVLKSVRYSRYLVWRLWFSTGKHMVFCRPGGLNKIMGHRPVRLMSFLESQLTS